MDSSYNSAVKNILQNALAAGTLEQGSGLTNPIHPLFSRQNFSANIDYDALSSILKLLSRLIGTPQVRHFLHVIWFGRNEPVSGGLHLERYRSDRSVTDLSQGDNLAVDKALLCFAEMINFNLDDLEKDGAQGANQANQRWAPCGRGALPGVCSTVTMDKELYDCALTPAGPGRSWKEDLDNRANLAMVMLHELGHAANIAVVGDTRREDFFEDSVVAEAGFEIQCRLFGARWDLSHRFVE